MFSYAVTQAMPHPPNNYMQEVCPDQFVGALIQLNEKSNDFPLRDSIETTNLPGKIVILILESPHIHEFTPPFGPAKGSTGRLIRRHLIEVLAGNAADEYGLVIFNAVQNQCSLGCSTEKYRDDVFKMVWNMYGRDKFIQRLRVLADGHCSFVINACTKGKGKILRKSVEDAILIALGRQSNMRITHPASWAAKPSRHAYW